MSEKQELFTYGFSSGFWLAVILSGIITALLLLMFFSNSVDVDDAGRFMCERQGLQLKSADIIKSGSPGEVRIVCKQIDLFEEDELEDGYLVLRKVNTNTTNNTPQTVYIESTI